MQKIGTLSTVLKGANTADKPSIWRRLRQVFAHGIDYERMPERLRRDAGFDEDDVAQAAARKAPLIR